MDTRPKGRGAGEGICGGRRMWEEVKGEEGGDICTICDASNNKIKKKEK